MYQLLVYFDRFMHYHGLYTCMYIQNMQNNKNLVQMSSNLLKSAVWNIEGLSLDKIKDPNFINTISKFHMISFVETWTNDQILAVHKLVLFHRH
jgi:hypothetical protein